MKKLATSILIISLFFSTTIVSVDAQTRNQQVLQRFQPNVNIQSSGTRIGGVSFSGVGSSVLACANVGNKVTSFLSNLITKKAKKSALGGLLGGAVSAVPTTDSTTQDKIEEANKKESCLDAIAYTVAKQTLSQVTNKTLNWINTGFGGNPFYIRDSGSFLRSIEKESFMDYINIAQQTDNQIIGESVSNKLIEIFTGRRSPQLDRLPQTEAETKYDNFSKNFTEGGWNSWLNITQGDQNPLGQFLYLSDNLSKNIGDKKDQTSKELDQGSGFLSQKQCVEWAKIDPDDDFSGQNSDGSPKCLKFETVTPGAVIASQVQNITTSGTRQLEAADELNEVLGAFFDSLLNKLFNKGLQTLGRDSGDNFGNSLSGFGGSGNNIVTDSNGQPINGTGSGVILPFNQSGDDLDTSSFNISNPRHITNIIKTQKNFLSRAQDSQASLQKIVPNLGRLDYCLPGPHQSWLEETQDNTSSLFTSIRSSGVANHTTGFFRINDYELFDPLKNNTRLFSDKNLIIQNGPTTFGNQIAELFSSWYESYKDYADSAFSPSALASAFASTENTTSGQDFAEGFVTDALNETGRITQYIEAIVETDGQYESAISDSRGAISELESIRAEVLEIVTTARNRHIAAKRALGITVNMSCLNEAYDISNSPINGYPREESDATVLLNSLENAQANFYNNL